VKDFPEEDPHPLVDAEPVRDKLPRFVNPDYPDSNDEDLPELVEDDESNDNEDDGPRVEAEQAVDAVPGSMPEGDDAPPAVANDPVAAPIRRSTRARAPRRVCYPVTCLCRRRFVCTAMWRTLLAARS
jgi:hypothetical protein